jgi:hypothetical protein
MRRGRPTSPGMARLESGLAGNDDAAASPAPAMVDRLSSVLARVDRETGGENRLPLQGREAV